MSILHSPRAPWVMLAMFTLSALVLFILATEQDMGLIPEVFRSGGNATVMHEVRRVISRGEERVVDMEQGLVRRTGEALEHAGQKLRSRPGTDAEQTSPPLVPVTRQTAPPSVAQVPDNDIPGRVLAHDFKLEDQGFQGIFATDRPIPEPSIFFIAKPARWVVDVPGTWVNTARYNNTIDDGFIRRVVLGEHEKYLRIVFHFRDTTIAKPAEAPQITRRDKGFTILVPAPGS